MRLLIVMERTATGYSAYCPQVPGVVAAAGTKRKTGRLLKQALKDAGKR